MTGLDRVDRLRTQGGQAGFNALFAPYGRVTDVELMGPEFAASVLADMTQTRDVFVIKNRLRDFESHRRIDVVGVQQIGLGANEGYQRHHHRFANRIDRRVGDLRKELLKIMVKRFVFV